jgi:hypothetical protein
MAKSLGGFSDHMEETIVNAIRGLAHLTNRYYGLAGIDRGLLCKLIVPADEQDDSVRLVSKYGNYISDSALTPTVWFPQLATDDPSVEWAAGDGFRFTFDMRAKLPGSFVARNQHHKADPSQLTPQEWDPIRQALCEWFINGARWGFVAQVFRQVNAFANTGDKAHVRYLLPGVVGLLRRAGHNDVAAKLMSVRARPAWRRPDHALAVSLRAANAILAESTLFAERDAPSAAVNEAPVWCISLSSSVRFRPAPDEAPDAYTSVTPLLAMR